MNPIGNLSPVNIRDIWQSEAAEFTPWLAGHADLLGEAIGMDLQHEGTEVSVGKYKADLVFREEATEKRVVVENMFAESDHDHLGKLITYAAGFDAAYAVLLAPRFRDEHRSALNYLNTISRDYFGFFGIVLEAWQIGDSLPAPRLCVEVHPDNWSRAVKAVHAVELSPTEQLYQQFWPAFIHEFKAAHPRWYQGTGRSKSDWLSFKSSQPKMMVYNTKFCKPGGENKLRVSAYIEASDAKTTKAVFDTLERRKGEIEAALGWTPAWERMDKYKASKICLYFPESIEIADKDRWPDARKWIIDALGRLRTVFDPILLEEGWDDVVTLSEDHTDDLVIDH